MTATGLRVACDAGRPGFLARITMIEPHRPVLRRNDGALCFAGLVWRSRKDLAASDVIGREVEETFVVLATVAASREAVYYQLWTPDTARELSRHILHAFVVPGTGPGAGEIHVVIYSGEHGRLILDGLVVEESRAPEYVRYVSLEPSAESVVNEMELTARGAELTSVRWTATVRWPAGTPNAVVDSGRPRHRSYMITYLRTACRVLGAPINVL